MSARSLTKCPVSAGWKAISLLVVLPLLLTLCASAEGPRPEPSETAIDQMLEWMVLRSPVIFSGEVLASGEVLSAGASPAAVSVVQIRVDHAVRGGIDGEVFSLGSWAGADRLRLAPHERVVLFLRQPNAAGITSSAVGGFGVLRIGGGDLVDVRAFSLLAGQLRFAVDDETTRVQGRNCPVVPLPQPQLSGPVLHIGKGGSPCTTENIGSNPIRMPLQDLIAMLEAITEAQLPENSDAR